MNRSRLSNSGSERNESSDFSRENLTRHDSSSFMQENPMAEHTIHSATTRRGDVPLSRPMNGGVVNDGNGNFRLSTKTASPVASRTSQTSKAPGNASVRSFRATLSKKDSILDDEESSALLEGLSESDKDSGIDDARFRKVRAS